MDFTTGMLCINKGLKKYIQEFDAEYYAKSLRELKMLVSSLMDDSERFMSAYQHWNWLSLLKSDTESDSDNDPTKDMPNYLSKEGIDAFDYHANINKFLDTYYAETHSSKDYKLLKGAFTSKKLKNKELDNLNPDKEDSFDMAMPSYQSEINSSKVNLGLDPHIDTAK